MDGIPAQSGSPPEVSRKTYLTISVMCIQLNQQIVADSVITTH